jgi:hypothetical protein
MENKDFIAATALNGLFGNRPTTKSTMKKLGL